MCESKEKEETKKKQLSEVVSDEETNDFILVRMCVCVYVGEWVSG